MGSGSREGFSLESAKRLEAQTGGSLDPVQAWTRSKRGSTSGAVFEIDVDRLGVIALDATSRLLEMLPLRKLDADKAKPEAIHFKCSHLVAARHDQRYITPTFPAREPADRRLRPRDRLRAGEALLRAFMRHVGVNDILHSIEITHAPLRLYDWQHLAQGIRHNGCPLRYLSLKGSRLGDSGLAALGSALVARTHTLRELRLDGCGLTGASSRWLIKLLQISNVRQKEGRRMTELQVWAGGLRCHDRKRARRHLGIQGAKLLAAEGTAFRNEFAEAAAAEEVAREGGPEATGPVGLDILSLAGNDLGDEGGEALANHLMQDDWLAELDLRRNGIGHAALAALRAAVARRETSEKERLTVVPELVCRLEGNAEERAQIERLLAQAKQREQQARQREAAERHARPRSAPSFRTRDGSAGLDEEARRIRKELEHRRRAAAAAATALEQVHRGARAASAAPGDGSGPAGTKLTAEDWDGLIHVSGGPTALLDAMESLLAGALQKAI